MTNPYEVIETKETFNTNIDDKTVSGMKYTLGYKIGERKEIFHVGKKGKLSDSKMNMTIMSDSVHQNNDDEFHSTQSTRYIDNDSIMSILHIVISI